MIYRWHFGEYSATVSCRLRTKQSGSGREIARGIEAGEVVNALSLEQLGSISCIGKRRQLLASASVPSCFTCVPIHVPSDA